MAESNVVGYLLRTGHGVVFREVKPACEVDLWTPLFDQATVDALTAEVDRLTVVEEVLRRVASSGEGAIVLAKLIGEELVHLHVLLDDVISRCEDAATQGRC